MKGKDLLAVSALLILCTAAGCLRLQRHPGGVSPSAYPMKAEKYTVLEEIRGESSSFHLFWFIPVTRRATLQEAVSNAIHEKAGDNLVEISWWRERHYWIVGTVDLYVVKGKVVKYKNEEE